MHVFLVKYMQDMQGLRTNQTFHVKSNYDMMGEKFVGRSIAVSNFRIFA